MSSIAFEYSGEEFVGEEFGLSEDESVAKDEVPRKRRQGMLIRSLSNS